MPYKILDLFAGAGGLSLGFEMTGLFTVSAIVENNKNAAKTYIKNHPGLQNYNDILRVDFEKLRTDVGEIDVVIGGPPCQGFSNANRQRRQLINGSNELVKRYVKAVKEICPNIFVMENVKAIASGKHSFCLTYEEQNYIENQLGLHIYNKEIVLYEGDYANQLLELYNVRRKDLSSVSLMTEEELYVLYNVYKKKENLKKYFSKESNVKRVRDIMENLKNIEDFPEWYNENIEETKAALKILLEEKDSVTNSLIKQLKLFWDIQRFYQGIQELNEKDAIYSVRGEGQKIKITMKTYVVIDYIKKAFEDLEYTVNGDVLNAVSFGVPQNRERYIFIGVKKDFKQIKKEEVKLPAPIIREPDKFVTVHEAIEDLKKYQPTTNGMEVDIVVDEKPVIDTYYKKMVMSTKNKYIYNHVCTQTSTAALERFKQIRAGENFHSLPESFKSTYENPARTQNTIYKRLDPQYPSDTVVNVRKSMWIHPELDRAVSAREAARLQSFPDSYKFYGTKDSVYQQIGNAVPPLLGRAIAESVLELLGNEDEFVSIRAIYDEIDKRKR